MKEIPKEMKYFGYRGEESEGNTQRDEMFWVQREKSEGNTQRDEMFWVQRE